MSRKNKRGGHRRKQQHARAPHQEYAMQAAGEEREHPGSEPTGIEAGGAEIFIRDADPHDIDASVPEGGGRHAQAIQLGQALRRERENQGLALDDVSRRLHLPWRVVSKLEDGDWHGIDSPLYLHGYLRSYTALLGMPTPVLVDDVAREASKPQPLVSTGGISRGRYLMQRYAVAGTYLVITALIVVPLIVLGLEGGLKNNLARLAPLDPPAIDATASAAGQGRSDRAGVGSADAAAASQNRKPLMASMAPVGLIDHADASDMPAGKQAAVPAAKSASSPAMPAAHADTGLSITLSAPSWVEITAGDGSRVEYALLEPGRHEYQQANGPLTVRLGNAGAAHVRLGGHELELGAYRHANVAYFRVNARGDVKRPPDA